MVPTALGDLPPGPSLNRSRTLIHSPDHERDQERGGAVKLAPWQELRLLPPFAISESAARQNRVNERSLPPDRFGLCARRYLQPSVPLRTACHGTSRRARLTTPTSPSPHAAETPRLAERRELPAERTEPRPHSGRYWAS